MVNASNALKLGIVDQIIPDLKGIHRSVEKSWKKLIENSDNTRNYTDDNSIDFKNADVTRDPHNTDRFTERMVLVLENQIARGAMAPNPFRRTRWVNVQVQFKVLQYVMILKYWILKFWYTESIGFFYFLFYIFYFEIVASFIRF